jgi:hypothetical protein
MVYVLSHTDKKTIKKRGKTIWNGMASRFKPHYKKSLPWGFKRASEVKKIFIPPLTQNKFKCYTPWTN